MEDFDQITVSEEKKGKRLLGWKEIAEYIPCSVRKAQRLTSEEALPIGYIGKTVISYTGLLDAWLFQQCQKNVFSIQKTSPDAFLRSNDHS